MSLGWQPPKPPGLDKRNRNFVAVPQANVGDPVPYLFGTEYMVGTVVYPRSPAHMISSRKSTGTAGKAGFGGGYASGSSKWFLNFMVRYTCHPIRTIRRIKIDENIIWTDPAGLNYSAEAFPHGYATLANSTIEGVMRFYFGTVNDVPDPFLLANDTHAPAWPGQCKCFFQNFQVGTSPSVPKLKILATADQQSPLSDPAKLINTGLWLESNPVHVVADLLTNVRYGAELPVDRLDLTSWNEAAAQVAREQLGVSGYLDRAGKVGAVVDSLLEHVGGRLCRRGPLWVLKLIRRTYSFPEVPLISSAHIVECELQPAVATAQINQLHVDYRDQTREYSDASILVPNVAHSYAGGPVNPARLSRPYFTNAQVATRAAQTEAPHLITPPDKLALALNRFAGLQLEVADVLRIVWPHSHPPLDGSRVWRVSKIDRPLDSAYARVQAYEEFAHVETGFINVESPPEDDGTGPGGGTGTGGGPITNTPLLAEFPVELPWDLAGGADLKLTHFAARQQLVYSQFQLLGGTLPDIFEQFTALGVFVQAGTLVGAYSANTLAVDDVGFTFTPVFSADLAEYWTTASVTRAQLFQRQRLLLLVNPSTGAHEFCAWQTITPSGSNYRITGILRGLFDTDPTAFGSGKLVFLMSALPFTVEQRADWLNGVTLNVKAVPYNETGSANPALMTTLSLALTERARRPFPVSSVLADGAGAVHGPTYTADTPVRLAWLPRTRGAGFGYSNPDGPFDPAISVEGDFVTRIYVADALTRTLVTTAGTTYDKGDGVARHYADYNPALDGNPASFTAKISARVAGWESLRAREITVTKL